MQQTLNYPAVHANLAFLDEKYKTTAVSYAVTCSKLEMAVQPLGLPKQSSSWRPWRICERGCALLAPTSFCARAGPRRCSAKAHLLVVPLLSAGNFKPVFVR